MNNAKTSPAHDPVRKIVSEYKFMILEGGQATEFERLGCNLNNHLWSAGLLPKDPEKIMAVNMAYLKAGADCITTATYQATFPGFRKLGMTDPEIRKLFALSIKIACESRDLFLNNIKIGDIRRPRPIVAGSIGSYGAFLADGSEYTGNYNISGKELYDFHFQRINAMMENESRCCVDIFAFETIPSFSEARILLKILEKFPGKHAWLCFSVSDEKHTSEGDSLKEAAAYFDGHEQISAIGVNCTKPAFIPIIIEEIKSSCRLPVIVYPNSGEVYNAGKKIWNGKPEHNSDYYELSKLWYSKGAGIIGGCCRTTPGDIKNIAKFRSDLLSGVK